jgi:hypothetical protein
MYRTEFLHSLKFTSFLTHAVPYLMERSAKLTLHCVFARTGSDATVFCRTGTINEVYSDLSLMSSATGRALPTMFSNAVIFSDWRSAQAFRSSLERDAQA